MRNTRYSAIGYTICYTVEFLKLRRKIRVKTIFDLSALDGAIKSIELENMLKEKIKNLHISASNREQFFYIPISGTKYDDFAFEYLDCYIAFHLKRVYSTKTWKPIKDIYTIEGFKIIHAKRTSVYENFNNTEYIKNFSGYLSEIESVDQT